MNDTACSDMCITILTCAFVVKEQLINFIDCFHRISWYFTIIHVLFSSINQKVTHSPDAYSKIILDEEAVLINPNIRSKTVI